MRHRPTDEELARAYELWVNYVHDEIPDGEFYAMTVQKKLEIIATIRHQKKNQRQNLKFRLQPCGHP